MRARSGGEVARTLLFYERQLKRLQRALSDGNDRNEDGIPTGLTDMWASLCRNDGFPSCPSATDTSCEIDTGDGGLAIRIEDETGRYNLNRLATTGQSGIRGETFRLFERLLLLAGLDPQRTGPIVDWVDGNGSSYAYGVGAEAPEYYAQELEYGPRNAPMASLRELALVLGVSSTDLVGLRRLVNTLDPEEVDTFNINTAPIDVLRAFDDGSLEPYIARIESERCREPFRSLGDLRERVPDLPTTLTAQWIHFASDWFRVRATGHVGDVYQSAEALLRRGDTGFDVVYYLPRRGPNIGGVDMSEATNITELASFALQSGGTP
jgi:type II secretory pathway component PulK